MVEWGRLLSGCRDYKSRPRVRIPPSPPEFSRCPSAPRSVIELVEGSTGASIEEMIFETSHPTGVLRDPPRLIVYT